MKNKLIKPFLKRAGGKRQLRKQIKTHLPKKFDTYYEPFLGGGAVLFNLQPKRFVLNDINGDLVNVYEVILDDVEGLIEELKKYKNEAEFYYEMRELDRTNNFQKMSKVKRAARLIYLNKTCYNGLFRVNSQGQFNVPFGKYKNPDFVNEITLKAVSKYLNSADGLFFNQDFEDMLADVDRKGFVYLDPPYDPVSDSACFTGYTMNGFNRDDQIRLKEKCDELSKLGVKFLLSNSSTPFILDLYKDYKIHIVKANRSINTNSRKRGKIDELLIKNYE